MNNFPYLTGMSQPAPDMVTITRSEYNKFIDQPRTFNHKLLEKESECMRRLNEKEADCMTSLKQMEQIVKEDAYHVKAIHLMIGFVIGFPLGAIAYSIMLKLFM